MILKVRRRSSLSSWALSASWSNSAHEAYPCALWLPTAHGPLGKEWATEESLMTLTALHGSRVPLTVGCRKLPWGHYNSEIWESKGSSAWRVSNRTFLFLMWGPYDSQMGTNTPSGESAELERDLVHISAQGGFLVTPVPSRDQQRRHSV